MKIVFFGASYFKDLVLPYLKDFEIELIVNEKTELEKVSNAKAEVAVLAAFGKILPEAVLKHFKYGILNIHPSLLPKFRGPSPVQTAILNGEKETGVTVIRLDEKMDHGPILAQKAIEISNEDTAETLYERLFPLGSKLIAENLEKYLNNDLKLTVQDHSKATYTKMLKRESGFFELENPPSLEKLNLMIRAFHPWPGVWTKFRIQNSELSFFPEKRFKWKAKNQLVTRIL